MKARNIKPGFWENEKIGQLTHTQRLLFIGLWCLADREGKLEDRPDRIKHLLFGYDKNKIDIHRDLTVISRLGFTYHYQVKDLSIIMILGFKKHQSPHHTEKKSILPDPQTLPEFHGELTVSHGENPPDSLNHESRIMNHESPLPPKGVLVGFEKFWKEYPKKVGKGAAEKSWLKIKPLNGLVEKIIMAVISQRRSDQWTKDGGQYIPHPSTWLNQRRWEDELGSGESKSISKFQRLNELST